MCDTGCCTYCINKLNKKIKRLQGEVDDLEEQIHTIPKGDKGDQGIQGPQGPTGATGTAGFNGVAPVTVYLDGVNGNDTRTGATNDNNATTGTIKTFTRLAALHSSKAYNVSVVIVGAYVHSANVTLKIPIVTITLNASITFAKNPDITNASIIVGDGTFYVNFDGNELNILNSGNIIVEAHNGSTGLGDQAIWQQNQCAIRLISPPSTADSNRATCMNLVGSANLNVGNNTVFVGPGVQGLNPFSWNKLARYRRSSALAGSITLGTNATESLCQGERIIPRTYTPTSSTDANVSEGELVCDTAWLYRKQGGTIRKIAFVAF